MGRKTFSISFFIRRSKLTKNLEAPVTLRITINGERSEAGIQRSIAPDEWNSQKGCAKSRTKHGKAMNEYLDQIWLR
jgi:hypothetical protein